jgi:threo-3-hydroxy-L-aspartate ammonia-lyase
VSAPAPIALLELADFAAARVRIAGVVRTTELLRTPIDTLFLKPELFQQVGAFKIRGAYNMVAQLSPETRARGVITYSSGNHGQAVAFAARLLDAPAVIVMPETAPPLKVRRTEAHGAEVVFAGRTSVDRKQRAEALAAERGLTMVPPFDDAAVVAGQGTIGLEIIEQQPDVQTVVVPVGGGGLLAGIATAVKRSRPAVRVIGVEPAGAAKMSASLAAGHPVTLGSSASIADGLLALRPGDIPFAHVQAFVDDVLTVTEAEIAGALRWLHQHAGIVAEPSGAAATAGVLAHGQHFGVTVAVVSGGNIAAEDFATYIGQ